MVDKQTIDRSIEEALGKQKIEDLHKEQAENLGSHSQEIKDMISGVDDNAKTNKLLNIAQIGEIMLSRRGDMAAREEALKAEDMRKKTIKHNKGAKESRSRIEGGIKDIKEMLGVEFDSEGKEIPARTTNTQYLKDVFAELAGGQGIGNNKAELDANNMMASFASQATENLDKFAEVMEKADKEDRRELISALNKVSDVAAGKSDRPLSKSREVFERSPILKDLGVDIDPARASWLDAMQAKPNDKEGQAERNKRFKDLRRMSDEGRLTKAGPMKGRSGVDIETMPEKNYEVLTDIYELLEKWYNEFSTGGNDGPGGLPGRWRNTQARNQRPGGPRTTNTVLKPKPTGGPGGGFATKAQAGQGAVQAKSGRWYSPNSTQGRAIVAAQKPPSTGGNIKPTTAPGTEAKVTAGSKALRVASKIATPLSAVLEGYDTYEDIQVAEQRAELGEHDEAFLTEDALAREKEAEILEGGARFATGTGMAIAGAKGGAILGATIGSAVPIVGTAAGAVVGSLVGGAAGYIAGSETGEAIMGAVSTWRDKDLEAAQDSGLYNWEGWGNSILDKTKLADAPSAQLQAIVRHDDLSEGDMKSVLEELQRRGGDTSLEPEEGASLEQSEGGPAELENATVPTADAVGNTMEALEDATVAGQQNIQQTINDNTTTNTTIEKGEGFLVQGPSTNDNDLSWMGKRNYVPRVGV